jgi:hypothetical protein
MIECLQKQIEECHDMLNRLTFKMDHSYCQHEPALAKAAAGLGRFYLNLAKIVRSDKGWGPERAID